MAAHGGAHQRAHLGVHGAEDLGPALDDGDGAAPAHERLGDLEPDVAATDDDDVAAPAALGDLEQPLAVVERLHAVHVGQVDAGDRRPAGHGAGAEQELVVAEAERAPVLVVSHLHLPPLHVDGHRLVPHAHVDPVLLP